MARSERRTRVAIVVAAALLGPAALACNGIIGLSDFEKGECSGRRCGDGGTLPDADAEIPDVVVRDAPVEARGADPVSWAQWPMPNYDGGKDSLPNPLTYAPPLDGSRVQDTTTNLVWQRRTIDGQTQEAAVQTCAALAPAGSWRLPKRIELVTLLDFASTSGIYIKEDMFPGVKNGAVWTSSQQLTLQGKTPVPTGSFWTIDFQTGAVGVLSAGKGLKASVLCVGAK